MRVLASLLLVAIVLSAQGKHDVKAARQGETQADQESKYVGNPQAIEAGKELFVTVCSGCHGPHGEGGRGPNLVDGRRVRKVSDVELFTSIRKGVPGTDMPPFPLPEEQIWRLVAFTRSLAAPAYETDVAGDAEAGKSIFFGKGECSKCHMIRGKGGFLGPDLTTAGVSNTLAQLEEALLDPNRRITAGYKSVAVTTSDGRKISGVAKNNSNYSIQVLDSRGDLHLLLKQNLRAIELSRKSLMPDDYAQRLTEEEVGNVLAFLSRQATRPPLERSKRKQRGDE